MILMLLSLPVATFALCPDTYNNLYNGKCYQINRDVLSWDDARAKCKSQGGELASIHNDEENDIIRADTHPEQQIWIGLYPNVTSKQGQWSDGSELDFQYFLTAPSTTIDPNMRGSIHTESGLVGQWVWDPAPTHIFMCMNNQEVPTGPCELDYSFHEELGLCVQVNSADKSWTAAEAACQADNAHLISIHDKSTDSFIRRLALSNNFGSDIYIGLHLVTGGDGVSDPTWTDSSSFDYQNFNQGMPSSIFGNCVAMETSSVTGGWMSIPCDDTAKLPYFCSKPPPCPTSTSLFFQGDVYSPDYPSSPSRDLKCEYFLAANNGSFVIIEFDEIQLINDDQIVLYDGEESTTPMAVVRGTSLGKKYITQKANILHVIYMTGKTAGQRKWHARFGNF